MKNNFVHRGYQLTEKDFFTDLTNCITMSYYSFNIKEILQKAKERYSKEKTAAYYLQHKEAIFTTQKKKSQRMDTKICQKKKKTRLKSSKEKDISN